MQWETLYEKKLSQAGDAMFAMDSAITVVNCDYSDQAAPLHNSTDNPIAV